LALAITGVCWKQESSSLSQDRLCKCDPFIPVLHCVWLTNELSIDSHCRIMYFFKASYFVSELANKYHCTESENIQVHADRVAINFTITIGLNCQTNCVPVSV
jgi:hypothetical protein